MRGEMVIRGLMMNDLIRMNQIARMISHAGGGFDRVALDGRSRFEGSKLDPVVREEKWEW